MSQDTTTLHQFAAPTPDLQGKSVLVTGGTGTFGRNFTRSLLTHFNPARLIVFSRDELKQSEMSTEFPSDTYPQIRFFIGDVRDRSRLEMAMRNVDYVVHAAALKQVPTAEYNPIECINTNVLGAENVVQAAIRCDVEKVIALSTDKAANPINLYGASKLASDKIFVAANNLSGTDGSRFAVVRYGNVIGSRGSVVEIFRKMIADNAAFLPVTDPKMTRFWISLEQGVNFVLSSLAMMRGGEIFVPKIPSMNVAELAEAMAPGLEQKVVGIRPGEKMHEMMISNDDARNTIELDDRYIIKPEFKFWSEADSDIDGSSPVPADFSYVSDKNPLQLNKSEMHRLIFQ